MKTLLLFFTMLLTVTFFSCQKDYRNTTTNNENETEVVSTGDLKVPTNFDWKTMKAYTFNISTDVDGVFEIKSGDVSYHKGYVRNGNSYTLKLSLPTYLESVEISQAGRILEKDLQTETTINCLFN